MTDMLLRCLRWDEEGAGRLAALAPADWCALTEILSQKHGLTFLARRLQLSEIVPPPDTALRLRAATHAVAARNMAAYSSFTRIVAETGRPALLLKGMDLADRLYGNKGLRPMGDLDFAVRADDLGHFDHALRQHGYTGEFVPDAEMIASKLLHHTIYKGRHGAMPMELHWRLSDGSYDILQAIWARALPSSPDTPLIVLMAPEDLVVYLCLHLKHHTFETPLTQIWDLAELITTRQLSIEWDVVWQRADAWGLTEAVQIALTLVQTTLGVPVAHLTDWVPPPSIAALLPDPLHNLGLYPVEAGITGHRTAEVFGRNQPWRVRLRALHEGALPPRREIRTQYGKPEDGFWGDCRSYLKRWNALRRTKGAALHRWLKNDRAVAAHLDRLAALRLYLDRD